MMKMNSKRLVIFTGVSQFIPTKETIRMDGVKHVKRSLSATSKMMSTTNHYYTMKAVGIIIMVGTQYAFLVHWPLTRRSSPMLKMNAVSVPNVATISEL
jgi:hypothetical protein